MLLVIIFFYKKIVLKAVQTLDRILFFLNRDIDRHKKVGVSEDNPFLKNIIKKRDRYVELRRILTNGF